MHWIKEWLSTNLHASTEVLTFQGQTRSTEQKKHSTGKKEGTGGNLRAEKEETGTAEAQQTLHQTRSVTQGSLFSLLKVM